MTCLPKVQKSEVIKNEHWQWVNLFTNELPKYFNESERKLIVELLKRYMEDGFIFWPFKLNFEIFKTCLNDLHPSIKLTFENPEIFYENERKVQVLNFLAAKILSH